MPAGRPAEYSDEICRKARLYASEYAQHGDTIPSIEGLAVHLGRARSTIHKWALEADKAEFSDIYEQILAKQAQVLVSKGLTGDFNSTITKLILSKHGYQDTQKVDATINDYSTMSADDRNRKILELQQQLAAAESGH